MALAIKTYLILRYDFGGDWAPNGLLRKSDIFDSEGDLGTTYDRFVIATLRDAALIVPEIGELAAPIIHPDAKLIDAEIEIERARGMLSDEKPVDLTEVQQRNRQESAEKAQKRLWAAVDLIAITPAKTERGAAIKERHRPSARIVELLPNGRMLIERADGRRGVYEPTVPAMAAE